MVCLMGMPVAYALGLAAILAALSAGIPLEAVMLKVAGGMGGIVPALLLGLSLIVLVLIIARREKFPRGEIVPLRKALKIAADAVWGMITVAIILGGILSGIFTPTESGAVACIYAFLVTML